MADDDARRERCDVVVAHRGDAATMDHLDRS